PVIRTASAADLLHGARLDNNCASSMDWVQVFVAAVQLPSTARLSGGLHANVLAMVERIGMGWSGVHAERATGSRMRGSAGSCADDHLGKLLRFLLVFGGVCNCYAEGM
ncbi:hypothetical protein, partial [Burkholderia cepacia]|uniref:hypothetical protein n=1 Tax=Burkholderia cepacia TaxID=292 RepID=UPI00197C4F0C